MQRPMLSCCYHVEVTEVFEGRLYPLISLSALHHTVDYTSRAETIFKLYILKRIISILTIKIEVENPTVLIEIYLIDVFHSFMGQDCLSLLT